MPGRSSSALIWSLTVLVWILASHGLASFTGTQTHSSHRRLNAGFLDKDLQADQPVDVNPKTLGKNSTAEFLDSIKKTGKTGDIQTFGGSGEKLKVCIFSADFWGLKSAGGTATAYHLLAAVLGKVDSLEVTFLQATKRGRVCQEAKILNTAEGITYECLSQHHFTPDVVESTPYEPISQAVVSWTIENPGRCDVIHTHEWGGMASSLVIMNHLKQIHPGLRVVVEPHGGHVWSQLGEQNRPMDVGALRIDSYERVVNMLNDVEISPTNYMLSFLKQRGWQLPQKTLVIPNVVPDVDSHVLTPAVQKDVWRIAFFGRLDERKGIKLFVKAVSELQRTSKAVKADKFEVYIIGPDATIDMMSSKKWLATTTSDWTVKTNLKINIKREEALNIIGMDGMLLILCSFIDNMPYVVAEAAVKGIPFLVFDAGGNLELFNHEIYTEVVVKDATSNALAEHIDQVLSNGHVTTVKLSEHVTSGEKKWLDFHANFSSNRERYVQEDKALIKEASAESHGLKVIPVQPQQASLDLWEPICLKGDPTSKEVLLLLPEEFNFVDPEKSEKAKIEIAQLMKIAELRESSVAALSFGIQLPTGKTALPAPPTWIAYAGDHQHCLDNVPVAISTQNFCNAFLGEARVFRYYNAWILAMLLEHTNKAMVTFPKTLFKAAEFSAAGGANCALDKIPKKRSREYTVAASRLYTDAASMMHGMVLAQAQKPLVSLLEDNAVAQRHKGWEFGYLNGFGNETRQLNHLVWETPEQNEFKENLWGCGPLQDDSFVDYPHVKHQLLHPCHHGGAKCCGGTIHAPLILRLTSFFHADQAAFVLAYDAYPVCGDGFDFMVTHYPANITQPPEILLDAGYDVVSKTSRPQRQKLEIPIDIRPGDQIDFVVDARHNHDCDGLYIVEAKVWPPSSKAESDL